MSSLPPDPCPLLTQADYAKQDDLSPSLHKCRGMSESGKKGVLGADQIFLPAASFPFMPRIVDGPMSIGTFAFLVRKSNDVVNVIRVRP